MSQTFGTPYLDDAIRVENGTQPGELESFVRRRALSPRNVGGLTVWNFNNHKLDRQQLRSQADAMMHDRYLVPFQVSGAWAFMASLLPERVREAEILVYDQATGTYNAYPNYFRHTGTRRRTEVIDEITGKLPEVLADDDGY